MFEKLTINVGIKGNVASNQPENLRKLQGIKRLLFQIKEKLNIKYLFF